MKKIAVCLAAACAALTLCAGCADKTYTSQNRIFLNVMDSSATLVITDNFADKKVAERYDKLCSEAEQTLNSIENSISAHIETSCVYAFNQAEAGATVEIDQTAYELLTTAKSVYELTEGYYNPAVYYSVYGYCFYGLFTFMTAEKLPSEETVKSYAELSTHFAEVELSTKDGKYYAKKPAHTVEVNGETLSLKIDLGGIGKGFAVDKVEALITEYGFEYGYFNFGTSSIGIRKYSGNDSGDYTVSAIDPRDEYKSPYIAVSAQNTTLATSGDYEQYYVIDGERYCHIIDPTNGAPIRTGVASVTVLGRDGAKCDAYTTALSTMGKERAVEFINANLSDCKVIMLVFEGEEGKIITNCPDSVTVRNENYKICNTIENGKIVLN